MNEREKEIEAFANSLKVLTFGEVVDKLIRFRIEDLMSQGESEDLTEKSLRVVKIATLKKEITRRHQSRNKANANPMKKVTSLKGMI